MACRAGNFAASKCAGELWIRSSRGGAAFFGASVSTLRYLNNVIEEDILESLFPKQIYNLTISPMPNLGTAIAYGMSKFCDYWWCFPSTKKDHVMAYNLREILNLMALIIRQIYKIISTVPVQR
jgi:hypothetical protein